MNRVKSHPDVGERWVRQPCSFSLSVLRLPASLYFKVSTVADPLG